MDGKQCGSLISWLLMKPAYLDLHCLQNKNFEKGIRLHDGIR